MNVQIGKPYLIVVEGKDDVAVLDLLLSHLKIECVQVVSANGKDNIRNVVLVIASQDGFRDIVRGVAIIRDADTDPDSAGRSCRDILTAVEKSTSVFLLPGDGPGMLEDLCLRSLEGSAELECVDSYIACIGANGIALGNERKFRMKAYLMVHDEDTTQRIGWAAVQGLLDPAHAAFAPLRQFLIDFTRA